MATDPLERLLGGPDPPVTPRPEFANALLEHLLASLIDGAGTPASAIRREAQVQAARSVRPEPARADHTRRLPYVWLAAAVLLVMLAIGYAWFRPGNSAQRETIPAVVAPATPVPTSTPTPGVSDQELLEIPLPAEAVPAGPASASLSHLTLLPDEQAAHAPLDGVEVHYVMSGQLTTQVDEDVQVLRADNSAWEPAPASTPIELGAGDAVLFIDVPDIAFANPGSASAEVLVFGLTSDSTGQMPFDVEGWIVNDYAQVGGTFPIASPGILLPGAPAVLRLNLLVLDPDALVPTVPPDRFRLIVVVPENGLGTPTVPNVSTSPDSRTRNLGLTSIAIYSVTLEIPGSDGTPLAADPNAACPFPVGTAFITGACEASVPED
jgi:hypothetical protein